MKNPIGVHNPYGKIGHIYFAVSGSYVKIGFAKNMGSRLQSLQTGNPDKIHIHESFTSHQEAEKILHEHFKKEHVRGEWFNLACDIEELWDDIWDYQGMMTNPDDADRTKTGIEFLEEFSKTFVPWTISKRC